VTPSTGATNGDAVGTWSYLAPEYKNGGRSSAKTDVYAFGLTMLQLLTASERPRELIQRCQTALEECGLDQV
jgi:serine/threonine protein kinase